jgi:hypothetical protein
LLPEPVVGSEQTKAGGREKTVNYGSLNTLVETREVDNEAIVSRSRGHN